MKKLLLLIACALMLVGCGCSKLKASPDNIYYTKADFVFSESKDLLEKSIEIVANNDKNAFNKMIQTGQIHIFKDNAEVYIVETDFTKVKVRLKGSTTEVWTVREAIDDQRN